MDALSPGARLRWPSARARGADAEDEAGTAPVHAGIEYDAGRLALRAGLEELRQTFGVGLRVSRRLQVDLAYLQHDDLEGTYLLSADVRF